MMKSIASSGLACSSEKKCDDPSSLRPGASCRLPASFFSFVLLSYRKIVNQISTNPDFFRRGARTRGRGDARTRWGAPPLHPASFCKKLDQNKSREFLKAFRNVRQELFFLRFFQKADAAPARVRWSPSAEGETPLSFNKRHGGVIFAAGENRGTTQVGGR